MPRWNIRPFTGTTPLPPLFDAFSKGTTVTAASITWNHVMGTGNNRVLVVGVLVSSATTTVTGVTWNTSEALTKISNATNGSARVELWYRVAPSTGTHAIVVSQSASTPVAAGAISYSNASQLANPFGPSNSATGTGTAATVTVANTDSSMVMVSMGGDGGAGAFSAGTGMTLRWADATSDDGAMGDAPGIFSSTATNWTLGASDTWVVLSAPLMADALPTIVTKTLGIRFVLQIAKVSKTLQTRFVESVQATKTLVARTRIATKLSKSLGTRFLERVTVSKTLVSRFVERVTATKSLQSRFVERVQAPVKVLQSRANIATKLSKSLGARFLERTQVTKVLQSRTRIRVTNTVTLVSRFVLQKVSTTKSLVFRFVERTQVTKTLPARALIRVQRTLILQVRLKMIAYVRTLSARILLRVLATRVLQARARISTKLSKSVQVRFLERVTRSLTLQARVAMRVTATRVLQARARIVTKSTKSLQLRFLVRTTKSVSLQIRARVFPPSVTKALQCRVLLMSPRLASGKLALYTSGTGTTSFDHFRATQFPDPALSLATLVPRVGATGIAWNALTPASTTLTVKTSADGVNWTDETSNNGGSLPGIYSQPTPTVDTFALNSAANYTSTFRTGGVAAAWTYDTANSRVTATGGTNALYVSNALSRADVDFFADTDQSDAGGLVWRYIDANNFYYLLIGDTQASAGTPNTITLYKVAANVQTQLATAPITYTVGVSTNSYIASFTRGTYHRFRVSMLAGVITVYADGVQLLTYTDGSPLSAGKMGFYNNGGAVGSRYYQLWMTPQGDVVTGNPSGDIVTGQFVYTQLTLTTTDPTATPQVQDLTTYAFTPQINPGVTIPSVTYNSSFVSKNIDDVAKQSNFSWYFDQNRNLVFGGINAIAAPWILQSAPAGLVNVVDLEVTSNLELDVSNDLYRNRQTLLGVLAPIVSSALFTGDGSTRTFTLGYPIASAPTIILNGTTQTVGLKGTTGSGYYYALNDPVIEQDAGQIILQSSDQLSVPNYTGFYEVNVTVDDTTEQIARKAIEGGSGIIEDVQDYTGQGLTLSAAQTLATQLIARYANAGRTLIFDTTRNGLAIGQMLTIFLPEQGIWDGQFLITQVESTLKKHTGDTQLWWYKVTCSELPKKASLAKLIASGLDFTQGRT